MKTASTTFFCDTVKCPTRITVIEEDVTNAYLALIEKGWKVSRDRFRAWRHFCPEHSEVAE